MRVLHVLSHSDFKRGGAIQAERMVTALSRFFEIRMIINSDKRIERNTPAGLIFLPLRFGNLVRFLKEAKWADILHAHKPKALLFSIWPAFLFRKPVFFQRGTTYKLKPLDKFAVKAFSVRVIAVSHAVKRVLVGQGIPEGMIRVIYGSAPVDPRRSLGKTVLSIGTVAAFVGKKGYPLFFKICELLLQKVTVSVLIYGPGRPEKFRRFYEKIKDKLFFKGFVEDPARIYEGLDLLLCTSEKGEGFTGSVREAMLNGVPVASTPVSGNPEFVDDGQTGIIIFSDPQQASFRIASVLMRPRTRRVLSANAFKLARFFFAPERQAERIKEFYLEAVS